MAVLSPDAPGGSDSVNASQRQFGAPSGFDHGRGTARLLRGELAGFHPVHPAGRAARFLLYESTGVETFCRDECDPEPRSHCVFSFHRPPLDPNSR
jgi:hypothetical protein